MDSSSQRSQPQKASLSVQIGSTLHKLTIFRWLQVSELKGEIYKVTGIPISEQRLFHGHIELSNSRTLEDYSLFDSFQKSKTLVIETKRHSGNFLRLIPGTRCNSQMHQIIRDINSGLKLKLAPNLTWDGTGGTYLMRDLHKNVRGVFKPMNEEAYAPMNPRGYTGNLNSPGIRPGILSGESAYREFAAYLLDHFSFGAVPATALVEAQHQSFNYNINLPIEPKIGSLQEFIVNKGAVEDFSATIFSVTEVQKIAILDMRILNMDRNEGNILVTSDHKLIPIDHGLSMPDCFDICEYDMCWMNWPQCKAEIDNLCLEYIRSVDPVKDITFLKENMAFRDTCLRNIRISAVLLKKGADYGLTLAQIGSLLYRPGYENSSSVIEQVISKSISLYKTINKSLSSRLKLEKCLTKTKTTPNRPRAYSTNEVDYFHSESYAATESSTSAEFDYAYGAVLVIPEGEKEDEDDDYFDINDLSEINGRSLSLPSFVKLNSKPGKEKCEAFDKKLFYYIEAFIDIALQKKVMDLLSKIYAEYTNPNGRLRSSSDICDDQAF